MTHRWALRIGLVGTGVAAVCCFTPLLVSLLTALGLVGVIGFLDIVLLPALVGFIMLTLWALFQMRRAQS